MATRIDLLIPFNTKWRVFPADVNRKALVVPAILAAAMLVVGFTAGKLAGIDGTGLFRPYFLAAFVFSAISILVYAFIAFAKLAVVQADEPVRCFWNQLRTRAPYLILPVFILPIFVTGFTTAKSSIPALVGYTWDRFWADIDVLIFGTDAWRITHAIFDVNYVGVWGFLYGTGWFLVLGLFKANVALYAEPRRIGVIYTAMLLTWILGGWLFAYGFSAAGPIFAHMFDPSLAERFAPLRDALYNSEGQGGAVRLTQEYLISTMHSSVAVKGGGISAMPSVHLGAVTIYILAARGTRWLWPALAYWIIIFLGSAYFGWHYWIDGIVIAGIAWACWVAAEAFFRSPRAFDGFALEETPSVA